MSTQRKMPHQQPIYSFIKESDELGILINNKANELYKRLIGFDVSSLPTDKFFKDYFRDHHLDKRLFYSIESSVYILYHSISKSKKPVSAITMLDYGAGLGTLFMLGSLLGVKAFYYNDHLEEWKKNAHIICKAIDIEVSGYIVGGINDVITFTKKNNITFDIIVSRNVIEHIYSLQEFYSAIYEHNRKCIVFSTTTANFHNPAMKCLHKRIHTKVEKDVFRNQRKDFIKEKYPTLQDEQLQNLVINTRGKNSADICIAVENFLSGQAIIADPYLYTNTCDLYTGVWAEHLLPVKAYKIIIEYAGFKIEYQGGFWDTHYNAGIINIFTSMLNILIRLLGKPGFRISPFITIIACNHTDK